MLIVTIRAWEMWNIYASTRPTGAKHNGVYRSKYLLQRFYFTSESRISISLQPCRINSTMTTSQPTSRRAFRRTDDHTPGTPKVKLVTEPLPLPLDPSSVLIRVHAVALNYRDANIANGGNPWPVTSHGVPCNDAAGEVIAAGDKVRSLKVGDRVAPITDTENLTGREPGRSWLAADEDGVLADHAVFDEWKVCKLPGYLDWVSASIIPCAGTTAWSALKGTGIGNSVLIQGIYFLLRAMSHYSR